MGAGVPCAPVSVSSKASLRDDAAAQARALASARGRHPKPYSIESIIGNTLVTREHAAGSRP
jgi:hypothetical protein